ncbi:22721_t:CDS:2 [Cetraspora pellucida]|uniref:22721_t:CDS:1 n=1 Tax=Cetraspora pellucida TaxID=1433469 RepID=A0A9N9AD47_9GLOM|nr:22721_t:CDS:2 [Cetraspora pellucida]
MATSNQDALLKIDIGDCCIVCFDVSACYRGNISYFDQLEEILDHPDAPGVVMLYLLSRDLSNWSLEKIPATKMKIETICKKVYQDYFEWCSCNGEKLLTSKVARKKFSQISIDWARSRDNRTTDMPIFNMPEFIPPKLIPPQAEKNLSPSDKKEDKQKNLTQALFDYVEEEAETLVASTSGTSEISKMSNLPEPKIIERSQKDQTSKLPKPIELINRVVPSDTPSKETDSFKPINEIPFTILMSRAQHEERLRKRAIELGEDSDIFVTITEKDMLDSTAFHYKMEMDARMCGYAKEMEKDPKEYMDMSV